MALGHVIIVIYHRFMAAHATLLKIVLWTWRLGWLVLWGMVMQESITSVAQQGFDIIVVAAGAACIHIAELRDKLPLKGVRAQVSINRPRIGRAV
jgi:hypothetical protein